MRLAPDREHPGDPRFAFDAAATLGNIGAIYPVRLAADQPRVVQYWVDLGSARTGRGKLALRRRRADEAVAWYRRAAEAYGRALEGRPNDPYLLNQGVRAR
jgi:hypothetical protein